MLFFFFNVKPFGLCFGIIPTCQTISPAYQQTATEIARPPYNKYSYANLNASINDSMSESEAKTVNANEDGGNNASVTATVPASNSNNVNGNNGASKSFIKYDSLLLYQITGFNEAKIYNFVTNQVDMIVNFDFYVQNSELFLFCFV